MLETVKSRLIPICVLMFTLPLASCGGDDGGAQESQQPGQAPPANFAGTYVGPEEGSQNGVPFDTTLTATLSQNGAQVTGTFSNTVGGSGATRGDVTGNALAFTVTQSNGCIYSGNASLEGSRLTGQVTYEGSATCPSLNASFDLTRQDTPPATPGTPPPPASGELDWETVTYTLNLADGSTMTFRVDDDGNYVASPSGRSGALTGNSLSTLDARIDAIKEEAHDPFECTPQSVIDEVRVNLTFANAGPAIILDRDAEEDLLCWSGDFGSALDLEAEMVALMLAFDR